MLKYKFKPYKMNSKQFLFVFFLLISLGISAQNIDAEKFSQNKTVLKTYNRAIERILQQDYYSALFFLDSVVAAMPEYAPAYNERGKIFHIKERYGDAIAEFEKATDLDQNFGEAYFNKAFTLFVQDFEKMQDSIPSVTSGDFDKAIAHEYQVPEAFYYRGLLKQLEGDIDGAIDDYSKAIDLNIKYAKAYHDRGAAKRSKGDYQGAIYDFRLAVTYDPKLVSGYVNMGDAKKSLGDYQSAERDYTDALKVDSTNLSALNNRGGTRYILGNLEGAFDDFSKALTYSPQSVEVLSNLGSIEQLKGNYDGAVDWFNQALSISNKYAPAILNRGLTYELQGKVDEACADWRTAAELGMEQAKEYLKECK